MLSISPPMKGAGKGDYYLGLAQEDYYTKGGEPPGHWYGEGAEALRLRGEVGEKELKNLLEGYTPDGKTALVQNAGSEDRRSGWDLTFSAPKSVSTLWSVASPEIRTIIQEAHREAVHEALDYLQEEAGITRRGKGGLVIEKATLVFAEFEHGTSRAQDPQLHTHVLTLNQALREDGTWGTIQSRPIFENKMGAGALYRAELAHLLEEKLNLVCVRDKSCFRVEGSPKGLEEEFSTRRKEIEKAMEESGFSGAIAARVATLQTRNVKDHVAREILFDEWKKAGESHGFTTENVLGLTEEQRKERNPEKELSESLQIAAEKITDKESYFTRSTLVRHTAEEAQGRGVSAKEVIRGADEYLKTSEQIVFLGEKGGKNYYTTEEILELEKGIIETTHKRKTEEMSVSDETLKTVFEKRPTLDAEQREGVKRITQQVGATQIVTGFAGTGKSYMLEATREAFENEGYKVYGSAPSGIAAQGLEKGSGICSATIHKTLFQLKQGALFLDNRSVLVVDEAGMVSTKLMSRLVSETDKAGAKLVLVGDERQIQSVQAGGALKALKEELGFSELTEIRRQNEGWTKEAVKAFAQGDAEQALSEYAKRGFVSVNDTPELARDTLIQKWRKEGVSEPKENIILASTNLDVSILNEKAQAARFSEGKLHGDGIASEGKHYFSGDRVLFTRNSERFGVRNGNLGTIKEIDASQKRIRAELDSGKEVSIDLKQYNHIKPGYAITAHKSQGGTFENAYLYVSEMDDKEITYVKSSRAKGNTHFFMDKVTAGEELSSISKQMERSHMKELATAFSQSLSAKVVKQVQGIMHER